MSFQEIDNCMFDFYNKKINKELLKNLLNSIIFSKFSGFDVFFIEYLNEILSLKLDEKVEDSCIIFNLFKSNQIEILNIYHKLLLVDWHERHEEIVDIIEYFYNKSSVNFLSTALSLNLDYLDYDGYYSFHKKIVWAIFKIDGKDSYERLKGFEKLVSADFKAEFKQFLGEIKYTKSNP